MWGPAAQDLLCALFLAAASSGRSLRECGRWLDDAGSPIPAELLDAAGFHALACEPARRAARRPGNPRRHLPDRPHRGEVPQRRGDHALGHPAAPQRSPGLRPRRVRGQPRHAVPADRVPVGRVPADRRADRRGRCGPGGGRPSEPAAGSTRRWSWSWTRRPTSAGSPTCPTCTRTSGRAAWSRSPSCSPTSRAWPCGASPAWPPCGARRPRRSSAPASTTPGWPATWPPWSASTTCRSGRVSYGDGRTSEQISLRRQDILEAADIRALAPGTALLLATGARPALISLRPWYTGPDAARITAAIAPRRGSHAACRPSRRSDGPRRPDRGR